MVGTEMLSLEDQRSRSGSATPAVEDHVVRSPIVQGGVQILLDVLGRES